MGRSASTGNAGRTWSPHGASLEVTGSHEANRGIMSEHPYRKPDFLEVAKHQFAQLSEEFQKAMEALKDPEHRKQLTSSYLDMLQKGLSKAQESVARYQEKIAPEAKSETPESAPATDTPHAETPPVETPQVETPPKE
jgi:chromosome segregation ATPase